MDIEKAAIPFNKPVFFRQTFLSALDDACSTSSCSFNDVLDKKKKEATECSSCYVTSPRTTEGRSDDITVMKLSGDGELSHKCTNFFREKYGHERSLLTPSCTAALEMAALLLDIQPGDEVIVPSFTFVTTASAFALRGAKIVFADSEDETPNVSVPDILNKISARTKAIVIVHYAGISVDVPLILKKTMHSIPIVEDCAHALDAFDKNSGDYLGKAGCLATFSFHETKNVGIGEGGLLVVNDHWLWSEARCIREKGTNLIDFKEGKVPFYTWTRLGSSYLMSEVNAAVLWSALQHLDETQRKRFEIWDYYDKHIFFNTVFKKPSKREHRANAHAYFLDFEKPEKLQLFCNHMKNESICVATHYQPLHSSPYVKENQEAGTPLLNCTETNPQLCNRATSWSQCLVRLPLYFGMDSNSIQRIVSAVNTFTSANGITIIPAIELYWECIRQLRNENKESFIHTQEVTKNEHWSFMGKHHTTYRVAIDEKGKFLGFVGHVNHDLRVAVCKEARGSGLARFMVDVLEKEEDIDCFNYKIKADNKRSMAFAAKHGCFPDNTAIVGNEEAIPLVTIAKKRRCRPALIGELRAHL